jgi:hypothetical protein
LQKRVLFFVFVLFSITTRAQETPPAFPKWAITAKPIGMIDPFLTNFTFSVQHHTSEKLITELQLGLIQTWYCSVFQAEDNTSITGIKIGGEVKYLFFRKMFVSAQFFHNNYIESSDELLFRYNRVYTQEMPIEKHVTATGGHFKYGVFLHIPNKRLFFEFYGGIGARFRTIDVKDFPEDAEPVEPVNFFDPDNFNNNDTKGSQWYLSVALGVAVGLKLGK